MAKRTAHIKINDKMLQQIKRATAGGIPRYVIADGVEYGVHQEFGPRGHPSARPAFDKVTAPLPKAIGQAIEQGISLKDVMAKAAFDIQAIWAADVNVDTGAYRNSIHVEEE